MERSTYLGVYNNNYHATQEEYPYRVAIKRYVKGIAEYTNKGYLKREDTAAYIYNIYVLSIFGKGAVINDIEPSEEIDKEIREYCKNYPDFGDFIDEATDVLEAYGQDIQIYKCG